MKFLILSNFSPDENSGAPGTLIQSGRALEMLGHKLEYVWAARPGSKNAFIDNFCFLPRRQFEQARERLSKSPFDVVIVSQPYGHPVYTLSQQYPGTLFLNRTHGWEERVYRSRHLWEKKAPLQSALTGRMIRHVCVKTARGSHGIIAASGACADFIRRRYNVDPDKVTVIPYGLEDHFLDVARRPSADASVKMLFVGNYLPIKGSQVLEAILPAIAMEARVKMTFVAPQESHELLKQIYLPHFKERLTLLPWTTRERLKPIYLGHDILLAPSLFEGFGKVSLEAMACGMTVISFDEGGICDYAKRGETAYFCETGDLESYRLIIKRVVSDPAILRQVGLRAQERVRSMTWERHAEEVVRFCERRFASLKEEVSA